MCVFKIELNMRQRPGGLRLGGGGQGQWRNYGGGGGGGAVRPWPTIRIMGPPLPHPLSI